MLHRSVRPRRRLCSPPAQKSCKTNPSGTLREFRQNNKTNLRPRPPARIAKLQNEPETLPASPRSKTTKRTRGPSKALMHKDFLISYSPDSKPPTAPQLATSSRLQPPILACGRRNGAPLGNRQAWSQPARDAPSPHAADKNPHLNRLRRLLVMLCRQAYIRPSCRE